MFEEFLKFFGRIRPKLTWFCMGASVALLPLCMILGNRAMVFQCCVFAVMCLVLDWLDRKEKKSNR
jgi:hypothetical protein